MPSHRRRGGHSGGDEVGAAAFALATFEVAIAGAGAALARFELVGVHGQAHAAAGFAPFKAGFLEDAVESLGFGVAFHLTTAGDDHRVDGTCDPVTFHHGCGGAEIADTG